MDSKTAFSLLCEMFPQIDVRIIKAVTLEHGGDVDSAIEFILSEVVPKQNRESVTKGFDKNEGNMENKPSSAEFLVDSKPMPHDDTPELFDEFILAGSNSVIYDAAVDGSLSVKQLTEEKNNRLETNSSLPSQLHKHFYDEGCSSVSSLSGQSNLSHSRVEPENMESGFDLNGMQSSKKISTDSKDFCFHNFIYKGSDEISSKGMSSVVSLTCESETSIDQLSCRGVVNASSVEGDNQSMKEMLVNRIDSPVDHMESAKSLDVETLISDADDTSEKGCTDSFLVSQPICDTIDFLSIFDKENSLRIETDVKDSYSSVQSSLLSCSGASSTCQIVDTDGFEVFVCEARKNKEALMEGMESVRSLWTKMHYEESAARHAKEEETNGGLDILAKVEELRQTLARAKETNDMHLGEVYGERAILSTEARELRSRLTQLAAEKEAALSMINEMCKILQARYDAARKEKEAALEDRMQKEETARKVLAMEEAVMAKVAEDSRDLEMEAETNAKLRDFLIDCGHTVDVLQGELSVLCQDVKSLKEQIDGGTDTVANGIFNTKLAVSTRCEEVNQHYKCQELNESTIDVSISSDHQADAKDNFFGSLASESFNWKDKMKIAMFMEQIGHDDSQDLRCGLDATFEKMNIDGFFASGDRTDSAANTLTHSIDSDVDHLKYQVESCMDLTHRKSHHDSPKSSTHSGKGHHDSPKSSTHSGKGHYDSPKSSTHSGFGHYDSPKSSNHSGKGRKQHSSQRSSDDDGWQILDEVHEGFEKSGSGSYPSLKSKQS